MVVLTFKDKNKVLLFFLCVCVHVHMCFAISCGRTEPFRIFGMRGKKCIFLFFQYFSPYIDVNWVLKESLKWIEIIFSSQTARGRFCVGSGKSIWGRVQGLSLPGSSTTVNSVTKSRHVVRFSKEPIDFLLCKSSRIYDLYLPFQF